jgi:hypothetical protein
MEAYAAYQRPVYPGSLAGGGQTLTVEGNERAIALGKARLASGPK